MRGPAEVALIVDWRLAGEEIGFEGGAEFVDEVFDGGETALIEGFEAQVQHGFGAAFAD